MERIPILRMGRCLLVTIQVDMHDRLATTLQDDLTNRIADVGARGVLIEEMANDNPLLPRGFWGGICLDPKTQHLLGARTAGASGQVIGT